MSKISFVLNISILNFLSIYPYAFRSLQGENIAFNQSQLISNLPI